MSRTYESLFEIKPGRFVFEPTEASRAFGSKLIKKIDSTYFPPDFYFHLGKSTGHVGAMRLHRNSNFFAKIDLQNFFWQITRTKLIRSLRKIGFSSNEAFDAAYYSVVDFKDRKFLPYGFVQSMHLATISLDCSALGSALQRISQRGVNISVYVDDIILSGDDFIQLSACYHELIESSAISNIGLNLLKCSPPDTSVIAFNCQIQNAKIEITLERMLRFKEDYQVGSEAARAAIEKYIDAVNPAQVVVLKTID